MVVKQTQGVGVAAYLIKHSNGTVQILSWPDGAIRMRGNSFDSIFAEFIKRCDNHHGPA